MILSKARFSWQNNLNCAVAEQLGASLESWGLGKGERMAAPSNMPVRCLRRASNVKDNWHMMTDSLQFCGETAIPAHLSISLTVTPSPLPHRCSCNLWVFTMEAHSGSDSTQHSSGFGWKHPTTTREGYKDLKELPHKGPFWLEGQAAYSYYFHTPAVLLHSILPNKQWLFQETCLTVFWSANKNKSFFVLVFNKNLYNSKADIIQAHKVYMLTWKL